VAEAARERIGREHRLRTGAEYAAIKQQGRAVRGRFCIVLVLERPELTTKVGFIASKKSVGDAVHRNRARRRLREIVRRRWPRVIPAGRWLAFIALRGVGSAPHAELVADVERLLTDSGAWSRDSAS
jgi:ribonuclease P protein component